MKTLLLLFTAMLLSLASAQLVLADDDDFDVDQADSLDFEAFHKPKNQGVKLWEQKPAKKAYKSEDKANNQPEQSSKGGLFADDQRFVARSQYSNGRADYSLNELYQQMADNCPNGWDKKKEWAEKDGKKLYLYASFDCR